MLVLPLLEHIITNVGKNVALKDALTIGRKRILTNASTGQTNTQYYMHGLSEYTDEMVDYITHLHFSYY